MNIMLHRLFRGRLTLKLYVVVFIIVIISICSYLFPQFRLYTVTPAAVSISSSLHTPRHLSKSITVVFRQFEDFENDIADSVQSFVSAFPNMPVIVICDKTPYPPFQFSASNKTLRNVKIISLEFNVNASPDSLNPLTKISTEFTLFVPDSTRVLRRSLQQASLAATLNPEHIIAIGVGTTNLVCQQVQWNYADWTLHYVKDASAKTCDAVIGPHALLIRTTLLHKLPRPFVLPFPEALYLQTSAKKVKVRVETSKLGAGRGVLKTPVAKQRTTRHIRDHRVALYKQLGVKVVMKEDGRVQWFGCKRETQRCFPSVQGTPSYVLSGRNTPPCCRRNMRRVAAHVLRSLLQAGARCWLETTSLLGAIISTKELCPNVLSISQWSPLFMDCEYSAYNQLALAGIGPATYVVSDLLPWAEHVEFGIHASDVARVPWLQRGGVDPDGFVWERATKGHYYTVAYSATNRVYVLVLPFTPKNGTMWPADWVLAHQREFPERHLHPLAQINFAGRQAPAPNDARAFLDLKLGAYAVERCQKIGARLIYP